MIPPISNSISFQGKIPIGKCMITDKSTNKKISATCYEYECNDKKDIEDFHNASIVGTAFRGNIEYEMKNKFEKPKANKDHHIYTIETPDGKIAANAHVKKTQEGAEIVQIGTNKKAYGLSGQVLIAYMGKELLSDKENGVMTAFAPVPDAIPFYRYNCGFTYDKEYNLGIDKKGVDELYEKRGCKGIDTTA